LFLPNGSIQEVVGWDRCAARLGTDWVAAVKAAAEKEAGTAVPVNVAE
jgi:hypothetical protein